MKAKADAAADAANEKVEKIEPQVDEAVQKAKESSMLFLFDIQKHFKF